MSPVSEYLAFTIGGTRFAFDFRQVIDRLDSGAVAWIRNTTDHVRGVIHDQGRLIPVVDLRVRFAQRGAALAGTPEVVVLALEGTLVAVAVDSVLGVLELNVDEMKKLSPPSPNRHGSHVCGHITVEGREFVVLDMTGLWHQEGLLPELAVSSGARTICCRPPNLTAEMERSAIRDADGSLCQPSLSPNAFLPARAPSFDAQVA